MADNTLLNPGTGGDTVRSKERAGSPPVKTSVILIDVGGITGSESIVGEAGVGVPVKGLGAAGTANAGVMTVQGIASMTPVQVSAPVGSPANVSITDGVNVATIRNLSFNDCLNVAITDSGGGHFSDFATQTTLATVSTNTGTTATNTGTTATNTGNVGGCAYVDGAAWTDNTSKNLLIG